MRRAKQIIALSAFSGLILHGVVRAQSTSNAIGGVSSTYSDLVRLLEAWDGTSGGDDAVRVALLFASGDGRRSDLEKACSSTDPELAAKSYLLLYMLGSSGARACASHLHSDDGPVVFASSDRLSEDDYRKLEQLFRPQACEKEGKCSEERLPKLDESLMYALVLEGSPRAAGLLDRIASIAKASHAEDDIGVDVAAQHVSLTAEARKRAHNLNFSAESFQKAILDSAFFLAPELRGNASVRLIARNSDDTRILIEVSYVCGGLCGSGYYVVLRRNSGGMWEYALVERQWIS